MHTQKQLFQLSETTIKLKEAKIEEDTPNASIWQQLDRNYNKVMPFAEETISKWSS